MPIKPENKKLYPKNWKDISEKIRFDRAKGLCEMCFVRNYSVGYRKSNGQFHEYFQCDSYSEAKRAEDKIDNEHLLECYSHRKTIIIVTTVAHLDHDPTNNDESNLMALCQRCHNTYDKQHRKDSRSQNKAFNAAYDVLFTVADHHRNVVGSGDFSERDVEILKNSETFLDWYNGRKGK